MRTFRWLLGLVVSLACAEQLPTKVFSASDGLHATVNRIAADSKGFVWFPGIEGLARFDGNGFRMFTTADGLPTSDTSQIVERTDGTYWVAARDHLCLFDPRPGRTRFQCESPRLGAIRALLEDQQGLWCGTQTGLWRREASGPPSWKSIPGLQPTATGQSVVNKLLKDMRGDIWASTYSGLYRFRSNGGVERWSAAQGVEMDNGTALAETPGYIWAGSQDALFRFRIDPESGAATIADRYGRANGLPSGYVADVRFWRGQVWAATFQGLARQLPSGHWRPVQLDPSVRGFALDYLAIDSLGYLWVGTDGGGGVRISGTGFSSFSESEGLGVRKVWSVFEDRQGNLMAVTKDEDHYFLNRFDGYRFHAVRPNAPRGIRWGWSWPHIVTHSRSGEWWLATGAGLLRYPHRFEETPVLWGSNAGVPPGNVFSVFEDSRGAIWASIHAVSTNALARRDPKTGRFEVFGEQDGLPPLNNNKNIPSVFAEDGGGRIWIGMLNGGLVRFRNGRFEQVVAVSGAPQQGVRALLVDESRRLWIGSRGDGLFRIDDPSAANPTLFSYTRASGLSSTTIDALASDSDGRIYAASGSGIDRIDPRISSGAGRIHHFTAEEGLSPGGLRVAFRDRHGALWFGGDQGLLRIVPQNDRPAPPDVLVYSIRVNGQSRPISDLGETEPEPLSLLSSERQLQVDFGGFRHDLLYQTRLSDVDSDWTAPSPARSVHYLSLAPGSYELMVRAVSSDGAYSPSPARVRFHVAPPFWQRWWFVLTVGAAVVLLVVLWHRNRLERELAIERVRSRIATDLHDDIGASLSRIAMTSEVLKLQDGAAGPGSGRMLGDIADTARSLVESMSDIVWSIDPRRDTLGDLAARLRAFGFGVLEPRGIRWTFDVQEETLTRRLSPDQRRQMYLILKEALVNVARHSQARHAALVVGLDDHSVWGKIEDDGCGYRPKPSAGLGILSMRERAESLGGTLEVMERAEGGTRVTFRFPLKAKKRA